MIKKLLTLSFLIGAIFVYAEEKEPFYLIDGNGNKKVISFNSTTITFKPNGVLEIKDGETGAISTHNFDEMTQLSTEEVANAIELIDISQPFIKFIDCAIVADLGKKEYSPILIFNSKGMLIKKGMILSNSPYGLKDLPKEILFIKIDNLKTYKIYNR